MTGSLGLILYLRNYQAPYLNLAKLILVFHENVIKPSITNEEDKRASLTIRCPNLVCTW
jgi:hypothetical protein